jgi:MFS family permease
MPKAQDPTAARRWTLVAAILGSSLAFVDGTVVNVALPAIQRSLDANAAQAQWVVEAYVLLLSSLLLCGGALGDRLGRRRMFMAGAVVFIAASAAAAASPSVNWLIAARAVQGVGAAFLVPGSLSLISSVYPEAQRGKVPRRHIDELVRVAKASLFKSVAAPAPAAHARRASR